MQRISVDELPQYSQWPAHLLGLEEWQAGESGDGPGVSSYDEQFRNLLEYQEAHPDLGRRELMAAANHYNRESPVPVSQNEELYLATIDAVQQLQDNVLVAAFDDVLSGGETVVALGCGWGYDLGVLAEASPACTLIGGELAANGVELGQNMFHDHERIHIEQFDYHEDQWDLFERNYDEDVVLFTHITDGAH